MIYKDKSLKFAFYIAYKDKPMIKSYSERGEPSVMDLFIEKIVKRRKSAADIGLIILIVLAAAVVSFFIFALIPEFSLIFIAGIIYLAYFLITKKNIEYEYAVTNGDIDIDMIIDQKKRKRVFSGNCKDFEQVARVKSDKYTKEIRECKNVKDYTSRNENAEVWFIYLNKDKPTVILFEPNSQMIDSLFTFAPRVVYRY